MGKDWKVTKFIDQECGDCIIRVEAYRPSDGDFGYIYVDVFSNGQAIYSHSIRGRLKAAWAVLKGHAPFGFEILTAEESQAVIHALEEVSKEAFPPVIITSEVRRGGK